MNIKDRYLEKFYRHFPDFDEKKLIVYDFTDSTNDRLIEMGKKGAEHGTVMTALMQTKGKGRSGRSFYSPKAGNLYISILLRPEDPECIMLITPAAAVAVRRAIRDVYGLDVGIKWVNDLYYKEKKISGILAEGIGFGTDNAFIVLGIGVNVNANAKDIPDDIKNIYGALTFDEDEETAGERLADFAASVYSRYMEIYGELADRKYMKEYREASIVIGKKVYYLSGDEEKEIYIEDIDDNGRLLIRDDKGEEQVYRDGEIRIRIDRLK